MKLDAFVAIFLFFKRWQAIFYPFHMFNGVEHQRN